MEGTLEEKIKCKLTEELRPTVLDIKNLSHLESEDNSAKDNILKETYFRIYVVSEKFKILIWLKGIKLFIKLLDLHSMKDSTQLN